jgi:hypothetical protein
VCGSAGPFALTGNLDRITLTIDRPQLLPDGGGRTGGGQARKLRRRGHQAESNRVMRHHKLAVLVLIMVAGGTGSLLLSTLFGSTGAYAQAPAPLGHRQPKATDVPRDPSKAGTPRSPEDIALERALNNICRGCNPVIPVRDVPRYDLARACPATSPEANDRCRRDEETAKQTLKEQWTEFTEKARSDCVQSNEIGGRPSYVQLSICLKTTQLAPTLPEGR